MRSPRAWLTAASLIMLVAFGGIYAYAGSVPPPPMESTYPLSPEEYATNVARTNEVEAADEQTMRDAQNGKFGPLPTKDPARAHLLPVPTEPPFWQGEINDVDPLGTGIPGDGYQHHWVNGWTGILNAKQISINAGSIADHTGSKEPEIGILEVWSWDITQNGIYQPEKQSGPLRVTGISGSCLTVVSTGGDTYEFDALSEQWTCTTTPEK